MALKIEADERTRYGSYLCKSDRKLSASTALFFGTSISAPSDRRQEDGRGKGRGRLDDWRERENGAKIRYSKNGRLDKRRRLHWRLLI